MAERWIRRGWWLWRALGSAARRRWRRACSSRRGSSVFCRASIRQCARPVAFRVEAAGDGGPDEARGCCELLAGWSDPGRRRRRWKRVREALAARCCAFRAGWTPACARRWRHATATLYAVHFSYGQRTEARELRSGAGDRRGWWARRISCTCRWICSGALAGRR